jgi:peptide chain release factor 1
MFEKLLEVEKRYDALTAQLSDPSVASDPNVYARVAREHASLTPLVETFRAYKAARQGIADAEEMLGDPDLRDLAQAELDDLKWKRSFASCCCPRIRLTTRT